METTVITETPLTRARNFLSRHRTGLAVIATAVSCLALNRLALRQHTEFLSEHGLLDEFYNAEED